MRRSLTGRARRSASGSPRTAGSPRIYQQEGERKREGERENDRETERPTDQPSIYSLSLAAARMLLRYVKCRDVWVDVVCTCVRAREYSLFLLSTTIFFEGARAERTGLENGEQEAREDRGGENCYMRMRLRV